MDACIGVCVCVCVCVWLYAMCVCVYVCPLADFARGEADKYNENGSREVWASVTSKGYVCERGPKTTRQAAFRLWRGNECVWVSQRTTLYVSPTPSPSLVELAVEARILYAP